MATVTITKETVIGDILRVAPQAAPMFISLGMHCLGCAMSNGETVEQACMVHDVDPDIFIDELNKYIEANPLG